MKLPSKQLAKEWAAKLKDSGFNDIESDEWNLKRYDSSYFTHKSHGWRGPETHQAHAKYFADARHKMHTYKFANKYERTIWWLHANGLYLREISKIVKFSKDKVRLDLKRLKREMLCLN